MAVLARGSVTDRPWGMTLGALGNRGLTGQLTLSADGKQYRVAFEHGAVVGAYSPLVNDAAVRLALTGNLITSSQVGELTRRLAAAPDRDEVDVIAELCRLGPEHAQRLRRRLVAQRAARTFAVDTGEFVIEDQITVSVAEGSAVDVRAVIFLGARQNLGEDRLAAELSRLGLWFKLKPDAIDDLPQYGFTEDDKPVLQMLVAGANVADIEAQHAALGSRTVRAVTYSLASCGACEASTVPQMSRAAPPRAHSTTTPPENRPRTPSVPPQHARTSTVPPQSRTSTSSARVPSNPPPTARTSTTGNHAAYAATPPGRATTTGNHAAYPTTPPPTSRAPTTGNHAAHPGTPPATGRAPTTGNHGAHPGTPPATGRAPTTGNHAVHPGTPPATGRAPTTGNHGTHPGTPPQSGRPASTPPANAPDGQPPPAAARTPTNQPPDAARTPTNQPPAGRMPTNQPPAARTPTNQPPAGARTSTASSSAPAARTSTPNLNAADPTAPRPGRTPSPQLPPQYGRTPSPQSPPVTGRTSTQHKTAPLGSRSPDVPGEPSLPTAAEWEESIENEWAAQSPSGSWGSPAQPRTPTPGNVQFRQPATPAESAGWRVTEARTSTGEEPVSPRTITESSGVPRATYGPAGQSGSGGVRERSPSDGVAHPHDRSPSGGVRPPERASTSSFARSHGVSVPSTSRTRTGGRPGGGTMPPPTRSRTGSVAPPMNTAAAHAPVRGTKVPRRPKQSTAATLEIESILAKKIPMLDRGLDYFALLGVPVGASAEDVRQTYFMLARKLHPDRLAAIGIGDDDRQAQRLMACINEAFAVLNDPIRREEYLSILSRGGEEAVRAEEAKADELAMRVMRAEEAFRQGEMALRREQLEQAVQSFVTAVELAPNEPEYQALLAWAKFAASSDKQSIAIQTRKALIRAADANEESTTARFYLGRVERMLGREKEALVHFLEVLRIKPNHSEASSEARVLEQRLGKKR